MDVQFDAAQGKAAWDRWQAAAAGLAVGQVSPPNVDPKRAALAALATSREAQARKGSFEALATAGFFRMAHMENLPSLAWALWYSAEQRDLALASATTAKAPEVLIKEAQGLRARMLKVLDYNASEVEAVVDGLAEIRAGRGHLDLAADLSKLASLYHDHTALLQEDRKLFQPQDEAEAQRVAGEILRELGVQASDEWSRAQARLWTLLVEAHGEVAGAGQFMWRGEPQTRDLFQSLYAAVRS